MFSVPSKNPIRNNREAWHGLTGFLSAMRITMLLFHPVSYRVGHHRHHRSTARPRIPFMSLSCTLRLVSPSSRVAGITHREFQPSATASQFPLNPISFTGNNESSYIHDASLLVDAEDNAFPIIRHAGRMVCIPRHLPIAVVSIIVPVPCPLEMTAFRFDSRARMECEIPLRATYRAC